jgi:hypothetical protein
MNEWRGRVGDSLRKVSRLPTIPDVWATGVDCIKRGRPYVKKNIEDFERWAGFNVPFSSKEVRPAPGPTVSFISAEMTERVIRLPPGPDPLSGGIIEQLMKECTGNICQRQWVHAFTDEAVRIQPRFPPEAVSELTNDASFFCVSPRPVPEPTIGYDFKNNKSIVPTHYTLRSKPAGGPAPGRPFPPSPRSWAIEVSNDRSAKTWLNVDFRTENQDLRCYGLAQTFECETPPTEAYRFIRLRITGPTHDRSAHSKCSENSESERPLRPKNDHQWNFLHF